MLFGIGRVVKALRSPISSVVSGVVEVVGADEEDAKKVGDFVANSCWVATAVVGLDPDGILDSASEMLASDEGWSP